VLIRRIPTALVAVNVTVTPGTDGEAAVTDWGVSDGPRVWTTEAVPESEVTLAAAESEPPPEATAQLTVMPDTGLSWASCTTTV